MLKQLFTEHPASVDETYGEHFLVASSFSMKLFAAACACALHAFLPFLFEKTGSRMITELHDRMVTNRNRKAPSAALLPRRS
jgi:hypothetical protein